MLDSIFNALHAYGLFMMGIGIWALAIYLGKKIDKHIK